MWNDLISAPVLLAKASVALPRVQVFPGPLVLGTKTSPNVGVLQTRLPLPSRLKLITIVPVKLWLPTPPRKSSCGSGRVSAAANAVANSSTATAKNVFLIEGPPQRHTCDGRVSARSLPIQ